MAEPTATDRPVDLQSTVTRNLKIIMIMRSGSRADLVPVLGVQIDSVHGKFRGHRPWSLSDIGKLAAHYGFAEQALTCDAGDIARHDLRSAPTP